MNRLKKALDILVIPVVIVLGYVLTAIIFMFSISFIGIGLCWLGAMNVEGPSALIIIVDLFVLAGFVALLRCQRIRQGLAEVWKQIRRNI